MEGVDILLEAFIRVSDRLPETILILAGPDESGLEATFRARARSAGVADRVLFAGMVTGCKKLDLLARADLFCLPSIAEGFSMAVLEALASGTPVMLSPGCHFPAVARYGAGWIVERTVDEWTRSLADALSRRTQLREMGKRALSLVRSSYTWDSVVDRLEDAYVEGIERRRSALRRQTAHG